MSDDEKPPIAGYQDIISKRPYTQAEKHMDNLAAQKEAMNANYMILAAVAQNSRVCMEFLNFMIAVSDDPKSAEKLNESKQAVKDRLREAHEAAQKHRQIVQHMSDRIVKEISSDGE